MKNRKISGIFAIALFSCSLALSACEKPDREPDLTPVDAEYLMPDPTPLTPSQMDIVKQAIDEYNEAVGN